MDMRARPAGTRIWLLIAGLLFITAPPAAQAQTAGAGERSIRGIVRDERGAVLAGVRLAVRSHETTRIVTAISDETGAYHLLNLPPGPYILRAARRGFITFARQDIRVHAGLSLGLDLVLKAKKTKR